MLKESYFALPSPGASHGPRAPPWNGSYHVAVPYWWLLLVYCLPALHGKCFFFFTDFSAVESAILFIPSLCFSNSSIPLSLFQFSPLYPSSARPRNTPPPAAHSPSPPHPVDPPPCANPFEVLRSESCWLLGPIQQRLGFLIGMQLLSR